MRLANFNLTLPAGSPIAIHPLNVVAITTFQNYTNIHVNTPNANGVPYFYSVTQQYAQVVSELNTAMGS